MVRRIIMKKCKVLYINTNTSCNHQDKPIFLEQQLNDYLSKGYEIKAVHADQYSQFWYFFLEKDVKPRI